MLRRAISAVVMFSLVAPSLVHASEKDNLALSQRFYDEIVNAGKLELIDELLAEDFVEHEVFPGLEPGREGVKKFFAMMRAAFPDLEFDVEFMIADGEKVASYITMSGTHKGEFMDVPATGKKVTIKMVDIVRIVDGKAVEHWGVTDSMAMMEQLGLMPSEPPPGE